MLVALALTGIWFRRPSAMPIAVIGLYVFIPYAAGTSLTETPVHPGTVVGAVGLLVASALRSRSLFRELNERATIYLLMGGVLAYLLVSLRFGAGGDNVQVETFIAPFLLVLVFRLSTRWAPVGGPIARGIIAISLAQVGLSALALINGGPLFYTEQLSAAYQWFSPSLTRALGTTDHPLVLSLLLASTIPLLAVIRSAWLQLMLLVVLAAGLLLTESRTGLLAGLIGVAFLTLRRGRSFGYRVVIVVGASAAAAVLLTGTIAQDVLGKFSEDGGSSFVRGVALEAFLSRWGDFVFTGWGNEGATLFRAQMGLPSSLESAFLIFSVNYGIVFTILYFGLALVLIFAKGKSPSGGRVAAIVALVLVQSFSSLGTNSASAVILWAFVAFATLRGDDHLPVGDIADAEETESEGPTPRTSRFAPAHHS